MIKSLLAITVLLCIATFTHSQEWDAIKKNDSSATIHHIYINGTATGRTFEGFGSLSAGASSRLLYDYPEPYRSDILDYLFKPNFGANIQHLKVEIGGDINSTDGSEPSIAATRHEFEHPQPGYFKRGYEYWLMAEARKRNPHIVLEGLQWGAPGWIGNGRFFSKDNAAFVCAWVKGAAAWWNLDINYVGIWNERKYDIEYIKLLRKTLDENGLQKVQIDGGDLWQLHEKWMIADDMLKDTALMHAVSVINSHTTEEMNYYTTGAVKQTGKPAWVGESHFYGSNWYAAADWARAFRSYTAGGITKVINWSLISSYHDFLVVPGSGVMVANAPWSAHYEVLPAIWAMAHINQFAQPGWKYLNSGCQWWASEGSYNEGLSMTTLRSPETNDYSIIIETMDAKEPQTLTIALSPDLSTSNLALFRSVFKKETFIRQNDIPVQNRTFSITVYPNCIYSLTTTRGQTKGAAVHDVPPPAPFPLTYTNDFEKQSLHEPARYFSDQHGTFEVVPCPGKKGQCIQQIATTPGICWRCDFNSPHTLTGDINRKNYIFSADVLLPDTGTAMLWGRAHAYASYSNKPFYGYDVELQADGRWKLMLDNGRVLATGALTHFARAWHRVEMTFNNSQIIVTIDAKPLATVIDSTYQQGVAALGTGWNTAWFDNIQLKPVP